MFPAYPQIFSIISFCPFPSLWFIDSGIQSLKQGFQQLQTQKGSTYTPGSWRKQDQNQMQYKEEETQTEV